MTAHTLNLLMHTNTRAYMDSKRMGVVHTLPRVYCVVCLLGKSTQLQSRWKQSEHNLGLFAKCEIVHLSHVEM